MEHSIINKRVSIDQIFLQFTFKLYLSSEKLLPILRETANYSYPRMFKTQKNTENGRVEKVLPAICLCLLCFVQLRWNALLA